MLFRTRTPSEAREGVTEGAWKAVPPTDQLVWSMILVLVTFLAATFVRQFGQPVVDVLVSGYAMMTMWLLIETQRHREKYSGSVRRRINRLTVALPVYACLSVGLVLVVGMLLVFVLGTWTHLGADMLSQLPAHPISPFVVLLVICAAAMWAMSSVSQSLGMEEWFFYGPRNVVDKALVRSRWKVEGIAGVAIVEILIVVGTYGWVWIAVRLVEAIGQSLALI